MQQNSEHTKIFRALLMIAVVSIPAFLTAQAATTPKTPTAKSAPKAAAIDSETRQVLKLISEKYARLQNWEANFTEERTSAALGTGSFNDGHFIFVAPNKFVYTLTGSEASDFISDGTSAWHIRYKDGRSKPAFVRHFASLKGVELNNYLFILRGIGALNPAKEKELAKSFVLKGSLKDNLLELVLEPKGSSDLARVTLQFKQTEDVLSKAILESALGNETTIVLKNYKVLKKTDNSAFKPSFPKGSKVEEM